MKNTILLAAAASLFLSACAIQSDTYDQNGDPAHDIACSWAFIEACYKKADELCPHGYKTINRNEGFSFVNRDNHITVTCTNRKK